MKIGIIAASGKSGKHLTGEANSRGHDATAIVRDKRKVTAKVAAVMERDIFNLSPTDIAAFADYAIAMLDEVEKRAHVRKRFTVVAERQ